tara:strand:+ start:62 stop:769 length:708 start_codon:yes stop_codon:yes gene_type:complete
MEINKIYKSDCLELMSKMPNNFVDITITSPPYNTGGKSLEVGDFYKEYKDNLSDDDYYIWIKNILIELIRVNKHYTFFNFQFLSNNKKIYYKLIGEFSENIKDVFIWHKHSLSQIVKGKMATGFEVVLILAKDDKMNFEYNNFPKNNYVPNIQKWNKKESFKGHGATMPMQMSDYFVEYFTKEGDLVFDCFSGLGTTCCSAARLKRNYIGSEITQEYIDMSNKRLLPYINQTSLF